MAGLDGIKNKIEPPTPVDKDLYELPPDEAASIPQAPTSLSAVIDRLEEDHEYLTEGGVFTEDLIETWISYKRLVPGYEAPINLVYSQRNRSACVRIPITGNNPKAKRLEFRCPDSSGNPYLAFAAMMMAGMSAFGKTRTFANTLQMLPDRRPVSHLAFVCRTTAMQNTRIVVAR